MANKPKRTTSPRPSPPAEREARKPKACQWVNGLRNRNFSVWDECRFPATFQVHDCGACIGHLCTTHASRMKQMGFEIR